MLDIFAIARANASAFKQRLNPPSLAYHQNMPFQSNEPKGRERFVALPNTAPAASSLPPGIGCSNDDLTL
jgi:hypothetical protein